MEVKAEVVARSKVGQPVVPNPDPAPLLFLDDGVHHRMGGTQPLQVCPSAVQPGMLRSPARAPRGFAVRSVRCLSRGVVLLCELGIAEELTGRHHWQEPVHVLGPYGTGKKEPLPVPAPESPEPVHLL